MRAPLNSVTLFFLGPVHGQTGWNGMMLFITRDSSDINAADEFARG